MPFAVAAGMALPVAAAACAPATRYRHGATGVADGLGRDRLHDFAAFAEDDIADLRLRSGLDGGHRDRGRRGGGCLRGGRVGRPGSGFDRRGGHRFGSSRSSNLGNLYGCGDQCELRGYAVVGDRSHAQQGRNLIRCGGGAREGGPLDDAGVGVARRKIGKRDLARFGPAAGEGERKRQILAGLGVDVGLARGVHQEFDTGGGVTGQSDRETAVGGRDDGGVGVQHLLRGGVITGRGGGEREVQRGAGLARVELKRVGEGLLGRHETAGGEIGLAEQCAIRRVLRAQGHGVFGEVHRGAWIALGERVRGAVRVELRLLDAGLDRGAALHGGGAGGEQSERQCGAACLQKILGHHDFSPEKRLRPASLRPAC